MWAGNCKFSTDTDNFQQSAQYVLKILMLQLKFPQNVSSFAQFLCIFNKNLATEKNIAGQFFTAQDLERKGNCFPFFFSLAIHWRPMFCAACGRSENLYRLTG